MLNSMERAALLKSEKYAKLQSFWHKKLNGLFSREDWKVGIAKADKSMTTLCYPLHEQLSSLLFKRSKRDDLSLFALLYSGLQLNIHYYWNMDTILTATPVIQSLKSAGTLGEVVLLPSYRVETMQVAEYIKQLRTTLAEGYRHQDYPVGEVFHSIFRSHIDEVELELCCRLEGLHAPFPNTTSGRIAVEFYTEHDHSTITMSISYNQDLIEPFVIQHFMECYVHSLTDMLNNPMNEINEIEYLSSAVQETLLSCSEGSRTLEIESDLASMFEARAAHSPERIALWSEGSSLTFQELNMAADQLAQYLISRKVAHGDIIGIGADRSTNTIIAILAVIKAGCAYMPLDPLWPPERVNKILADSQAQIVIICEQFIQVNEGIDVINMNMPLPDCEGVFERPTLQGKDLAYVLYTSGSTGTPKGVMIEHRNVINLIQGLQGEVLKVQAGSKAACVAPLYFDASVKQVFASLLLGYTLYLVPDEVRLNGEALWEFYVDHHIELSDGTPMHLQMLTLAAALRRTHTIPVKQFMIGGEALPAKVVADFIDVCKSAAPIVTNVYGPTECCVDSTAYHISSDELGKLPPVVPIGRPLINQEVYILDKQMKVRPVGAVGEIYITGLNVGRGYLHQEELTSERFINHPFNHEIKLYRTGDLGRWLEDSQIEYLGRRDHQVKLNGYRIDLGDVEQSLLHHAHVKSAVASLINDGTGERMLAIYYISEPLLSESEAREFLLRKLPAYMIPTCFQPVESFPVTPNGKIDRKKLPQPQSHHRIHDTVEEPQTEWEKLIAEVWSKVLGEARWNVHDSFFAVGGNSLKALQMKLELEKRGVQVKLHNIFKHQTIRNLAESSILENGLHAAQLPEAQSVMLPLEELFQLHEIEGHASTVVYGEKDWRVWRVHPSSLPKAMELAHSQPFFLSNLAPHFIDTKSHDDEQLLRPLRDGFANDVQQFVDAGMEDNIRFSQQILHDSGISKFELSAIQKAFLASSTIYSGRAFPLRTTAGAGALQEAIASLIREQALLRSELLTDEEGRMYWKEHECPAQLTVPYLDLSECSLPEQMAAITELWNRLYYAPYKKTGLLYRILLIKLNLQEYHLLFPCHHAIYDGMSGAVIERAVLDRLHDRRNQEDSFQRKSLPHYQDYVNQIQKGPQLKEEEISKAYRLYDYDMMSRQLSDWLQTLSVEKSETYRLEIPFHTLIRNLSEEQIFNVSLQMVRQFFKKHTLYSALPLLMFYYGRRYERAAFYDTVGPFIDLIPIVLDDNEREFTSCIHDAIQLATEQNINFVSFLFDDSVRKRFPGVSELIHPTSHSGILFNYHGKEDQEKLEMFNLLQQPEERQHEGHANLFSPKEIAFDIMYSDEVFRVSVTCPFEISEQEIAREFEQLLSDSASAMIGI